MNSPDLSIIIINWKSRDFVGQCLATLFGNNTTLIYEVIVVDNASFDGIAGMLASEFPQVTFIQCEHNLGFAGANNLAFARSRGRNVLFLNPDTEIVGDAIQVLVSTLERLPDAGMVGARLLNSDLSLQTTCVTSVPGLLNQTLNSHHLRTAFPRWKLWGMRALFESSKQPVQVQAISGACMLARRGVLNRVGAFSTQYFMYAEDMDLCVKITQAGSAIYYVPEASIIHHGGGSSARRQESDFSSLMIRESLMRFFALHRGRAYAASYRASLVVASALRILFLLIVFPILFNRRGFSGAVQPLRKWFNIFLWSVGLRPTALSRSLDEPAASAVRCDITDAPVIPQ
ncbi:glycosyltransferase family 2 protein [Edaphobacter paludis]|uniref:Glycosyltransferase family 2 protein n=1 Tax=Edaphobacter paludis TaxID=3035702 RepID=A0AAU7CUA1_9BACT